MCGDCSVLSSGGATMFAICTACAAGGSDLRRPWLALAGWVGVLVLLLAAVAVVLAFARA
ncbi:MAG: hypothetical protein K8M05_25310 [Deltaproteobacteria bacterium]|nr:hypothetical protein [Kofleriaceae bacterium]